MQIQRAYLHTILHMCSAWNNVWLLVDFWVICGIFVLEFKCLDIKIQTRLHAKIAVCSAHNLHVCISAFINTLLTYVTSLNSHCMVSNSIKTSWGAKFANRFDWFIIYYAHDMTAGSSNLSLDCHMCSSSLSTATASKKPLVSKKTI